MTYQVHHVRQQMVDDLKNRFPDLAFSYLIGGQTSFDVVPKVDLRDRSFH